MREQIRHQIVIALTAALIFFIHLGGARLWDVDEAAYASCAREMFERGDWVVPVFNGTCSFEKPPLMFWGMMAGFQMFGVTEFAARFWSAVLGIGTALLTYHLGRILFNARIGFWAGLITASSIIFTVSARAATVDSALVFLTTGSILAFVVGMRCEGRAWCELAAEAMGGQSLAQSNAWRSWIAWALMYVCFGIAVLAKGPVGLLLPAATIGLFLAIKNCHTAGALPELDAGNRVVAACKAIMRPLGVRNLVRSAWQMRPLTGIVVFLAVVAPWCVWVSLRTDGQWLVQFLGTHNFQRAMVPFDAHSGPIFYYLIAILIGFFPWSVFLTPSVVNLRRCFREQSAWRDSCALVVVWIGVFVVFWSLLKSKLPHYILPAYPALALLTGCFIDRWLTAPASMKRGWLRNAWISLIVVGLGMMIVVPFVTARFLPGEAILGLVGVVPCVGGAWCWWQAAHGRHAKAAFGFAVTSAAFLIAIFGFAALRVDRYQPASDLMAAVVKDGPKTPRLISYQYRLASVIYYAGRPVPHCANAAGLADVLRAGDLPYIVTDAPGAKDILERYGDVFSELARHPKFLRKGDVVVLTPHADRLAARTAEGPGAEVAR